MIAEQDTRHAQVERILRSKAFRTSEAHRNLLSYLADKSLEGTADELKEYTVGLDVFGKPSSFDPRQESVVRMHMARLRQKLTEYYKTEGADDPVVVDLPKGAFKVTFDPRQVSAEAEVAAPPVVRRPRELILVAALLIAVICAGYFGFRLWRVEPAAEISSTTPELQKLWAPMLNSQRPLMVCLSTPLFVKVPGVGMLRDSSMNDWNDASKTKLKQQFSAAVGAAPAFGFTEIGTASGAFLLGRFLAARTPNVLLTRSDIVSAPELTMDNVIFVGPVNGNRALESIEDGRQIILEADGIRNLNPQTGEPAFIPERTDGFADSQESHALVSLMPGLYGSGEILYFSGNQMSSVMAGIQAFTNPNLARTIVAKMKGPDGSLPRYYQLVLKVKSMDEMPIEITYMFHRDLSSAKTPSPLARK